MSEVLAFDMSRFQRVIATQGRIKGSFVVQGSEHHGVFAVEPMEVILYDEDRSWGQILRPGDFEVTVKDGVPSLGKCHNSNKVAVLDEYREMFNALLPLVVEAYIAGVGSQIELHE